MTTKEYTEYIRYEKKLYFPHKKDKIIAWLTNNERYFFWKYLFFLRKEELFSQKWDYLSKILVFVYRRKRNRIGNVFGIKIRPFVSGCGINIHHRNVIINAKIGSNCIFHGDNCLGNNTMVGRPESFIPTVGDSVDFGYGAMVFGNVKICSDVKIGAGAVVVKDISEQNTVWAGVPAKCLSHSEPRS